MKTIFIYGPPAAGKLTVANEVARRTCFKVFHNHLSIDAIQPIFDFGTKPFARLVEMIRVETVGEAARENVDLIYTFCYAKGLDEDHVEKIVRAVEDNGGEIGFVQLVCEPAELYRRVVLPERLKFGKASSQELMDTLLTTYDLRSTVPGADSLTIDTTNVPAEVAADIIIKHYGLTE